MSDEPIQNGCNKKAIKPSPAGPPRRSPRSDFERRHKLREIFVFSGRFVELFRLFDQLLGYTLRVFNLRLLLFP